MSTETQQPETSTQSTISLQLNNTNTSKKLSEARFRLAATSSGELVFFAGGSNSTRQPSDRVDIYNVTSGSWTTTTLSIPRGDLAATSSQNLVFFGGGWDGNKQNPTYYDRVDIYNALNGSWSTATLSQPRCCLAATSVGNLVLFGGGRNSKGPSNVVDVFDVTNNTWTTATLSQPRWSLAATSVDNRYALFGGGMTGSGPSKVVDIFDSLSGKWNTTTLSQARSDLAATSLGNLAFFAGGITSENQSSNVVDIFNSTTQTWNTSTLSQARHQLAASSTRQFVAFGGGTLHSCKFSSTVNVYDFESGQWFSLTLQLPRFGLDSTSIANKIIFGGGHFIDPTDTIDIFNLSGYTIDEVKRENIKPEDPIGPMQYGFLYEGEPLEYGSIVFKGSYKGMKVMIKNMTLKKQSPSLQTSLFGSQNGKIVLKNPNESPSNPFEKELNNYLYLTTLDHPNIVKCIAACIEPYQLRIVTEYCNGGSLFDLLHNENEVKLSTEQQLDYALKIAEGMEYLHSHKPMIVHRDLKSLNILLHDGVPKIIDFDVSRTKGDFTTSLKTQVGTYNWMAPEVMNNEPYTEKADVWSFGMILYELTTKKIPYDYCGNNVPFLTKEVVVNKKTPPIPEEIEIHPTLRELMKQCWNWDPQQRPSFSHIVQTLRDAKDSSHGNVTSSK